MEMESLKVLPFLFVSLALAGIIGGASVLSIGTFGDSMTKCDTTTGVNSESINYNETPNQCWNGTDAVGNKTIEFQTTLETKNGLLTVAEQFPTLGIIAVMIIIIALIAGVMTYFNVFKG